MARRSPRIKVPSVAEIRGPSGPDSPVGKAFESHVIGRGQRIAPSKSVSRAGDAATSMSAKMRSRMLTDYETAMDLQEARDGDDSDLLPYQPTPSINPPRPRTVAAGYDARSQTLRVRFRDGTPWEYYDVDPRTWQRFKRVKSPGRFINRVLNQHPYARGNF